MMERRPESSPRGSTVSRVQSIERAFAVLAALTDGPVGVTDVAERADLPKSTAARLLASLAARRRRRAGAGRHALPARAAASRRSPPASPGARRWSRRPAAPRRARRRRSARPPACRFPTGESSTTSTRSSTTRTRSGSATGPARASRCTRSRAGWSSSPSGRPRPSSATWPSRPSPSPSGRSRIPRPCASGSGRSRSPAMPGSTTSSRWASRRWPRAIADASGEVVAAIHVHGPSYRFPPARPRGRARPPVGDDRGPDHERCARRRADRSGPPRPVPSATTFAAAPIAALPCHPSAA